jgi:hypothetical protein
MLAPQILAFASAIGREAGNEAGSGERDMSGLALLTGVILVFAGATALIGLSSLVTLTRIEH